MNSEIDLHLSEVRYRWESGFTSGSWQGGEEEESRDTLTWPFLPWPWCRGRSWGVPLQLSFGDDDSVHIQRDRSPVGAEGVQHRGFILPTCVDTWLEVFVTMTETRSSAALIEHSEDLIIITYS